MTFKGYRSVSTGALVLRSSQTPVTLPVTLDSATALTVMPPDLITNHSLSYCHSHGHPPHPTPDDHLSDRVHLNKI